jgi:hypothetical protein
VIKFHKFYYCKENIYLQQLQSKIKDIYDRTIFNCLHLLLSFVLISFIRNSLRSPFSDKRIFFYFVYSEHRELYSNMGMRIEYTIFLMMRLKSFRPEIDKNWQPRRECQKYKKKSPINDFKTKMISWTSKKCYLSNKRQ